ncbi:MAG: hypothetical protein RIM99_06045 [Cyclobacteriaceae bacterium]
MKEKDKFLEFGYKAGIVLAFVGIISSAVYLFVFINGMPDAASFDSEIRLLGLSVDMRLRFLSTAIFVGMSFGFLGFSLFLIQAKGDVDVDASSGDYKLKIARLSPGLFVILCATVIIIVCATFKIDYSLNTGQPDTIIQPYDIDDDPDPTLD